MVASIISLYVLRSEENGKRYVGITNNLARRLNEHRQRTSKGGQILGKFRVILTEPYPSYSQAREREKFLKSGQGRKWLDLLGNGPAKH